MFVPVPRRIGKNQFLIALTNDYAGTWSPDVSSSSHQEVVFIKHPGVRPLQMSPFSMPSETNAKSVNTNPKRHTSRGHERQQPQSQKILLSGERKNTTSVFLQESRTDHLPRSPSPFFEEKGSRMSMSAVATLFPNLKGSRSNKNFDSSQKMESSEIPFVEGDGTWRNHGKLFRASIVLADEENGGNMFALSDSCAIERYYRVADRVLEQFLSSNIAERNELIESYIVGNRLFKFLSVVLPTHHQYFSSDPRLEELRNCSESQLMELLEYMEELELMIDEMEYNRYILQDLTPSEAKDDALGTNFTTSTIPQEDRASDENFINDFGGKNRIVSKDGEHTILSTKRNIPAKRNQESSSQKQQEKQSQQNVAHHFDRGNGTYGRFDGGSRKATVHDIKSSNEIQERSKSYTFDSSNHHEMLKQRVAAVVKAGSTTENSTAFRRPIQPTYGAGRHAKFESVASPKNEEKCLDSFPDMSFVEFQDFSENAFEHQGLFQDTPFPPNCTEAPKRFSDRGLNKVDRQSLHKSSEDSQMSWDADFSQFNVFSEKIEEDNRTGFGAKSTRGGKQLDWPKPLPKIKEPPVPYPRSVWDHAQVQQATRLSSSSEGHKLSMKNEYDTESSSDIFYSLEDSRPKAEAVKTRIEERLERASRGIPSPGDKKVSFAAITQYENSSPVLEANSHRKLLNQFRGCVRFLLD